MTGSHTFSHRQVTRVCALRPAPYAIVDLRKRLVMNPRTVLGVRPLVRCDTNALRDEGEEGEQVYK